MRVRDSDGAEGLGYTYTVNSGGAAIPVLVDRYLAPVVVGRDADRIEQLWQKMWWALHYGGRGGPAVLAISAVDIALWDLRRSARAAAVAMLRRLRPARAVLRRRDRPAVPARGAAAPGRRVPRAGLSRDQDEGRARPTGRGRRAGARDAQAPRRRLPADGRRQHALVGRPGRSAPPGCCPSSTWSGWRSRRSPTTSPGTRASCARAACRWPPARTCARCRSSSR